MMMMINDDVMVKSWLFFRIGEDWDIFLTGSMEVLNKRTKGCFLFFGPTVRFGLVGRFI